MPLTLRGPRHVGTDVMRKGLTRSENEIKKFAHGVGDSLNDNEKKKKSLKHDRFSWSAPEFPGSTSFFLEAEIDCDAFCGDHVITSGGREQTPNRPTHWPPLCPP